MKKLLLGLLLIAGVAGDAIAKTGSTVAPNASAATITGTSSVLTPTLDVPSAGVLAIGPTVATGVTVGSASVAPSFPGGLTIATTKAIDTTAGSGTLNIAPTNATTVAIGNASATTTITGAANYTLASSALTVSSTAATARAGMRNANTRNIIRAGSVAVPDCAAGTLNLTVTQFLDAGVATCGTAQTINFPTWQGASGIVQGLPGTPAVGDFVEFLVVASAANALTVGAGTGGTLGGSATVPANTDKLYRCRITSVTGNSETATCY